MKKILLLITFIITINVTFAQDLKESKQAILNSINARPFLYSAPVIKYENRGVEYIECKSLTSDITYKYIFNTFDACICIIWDIPSKKSCDEIINCINTYYGCTYIWNNKWIRFNDRYHGSTYYVIEKVKKGYTLTIW